MFKLTRDKYIAALESAEELEKTLQKELENLGISSKNLSGNWQGTQAERSLAAINASLEAGNHAKALAYTQGMISVMGEYLPEIEKLMAKREQIGRQLEQDEYVEPDLTSFCENELIINYDYIDDIKADVEGALLRGDAAIEILEEMIEGAEECAGEYINLTHVRELLEEGKKKLHRLENYRDEFVDFGKKMSDMEYNMSMDLANVMRELGEDALLANPMNTSVITMTKRTKRMGQNNNTETLLPNIDNGKTEENNYQNIESLHNEVEKYIYENNICIINVENREKQIEFLNSILEGAIEVDLVTGIPWQITLAQAALETGWGENLIVDMYTGEYSNNLFGIKYYGSPDNVDEYVRCWTTEWIKESDLEYWKKEHESWSLNNEELVNTGIKDSNGKLKIQVIQPFKRFTSTNESIIGHSEVLNKSVYESAIKYIHLIVKWFKYWTNN